ncbi:hypothetical protein NQ186_04845 [Pseudomonas zeae]|uniref:hypothetical protein n=1 Tax=Pseudomonas TaxID=286 RepID=UPI002147AEC6|nr:hypothetical protein [Pseudomonas zeae]UUT13512.1 hypothetical protein NQ186_04845 [Pseudomonas zeae]
MDLPGTFDAWEKRLVDYFLAIGPDGDASPIRAFEVTSSTLTLACGAERGNEATVEELFRKMLSRDPLLMDSLRDGAQRFENNNVPNCFSYLAFTLLIDNLLEGNAPQSGEYRHKLVKWLGANTTVSNLRGIALMWEGLERWLDKRIQAGEPFRRLVLPDPGNWTHIGYTRRLSFPSKADLKLVTNFCQGHPGANRDLHISIAAFPRELVDDRASWGLRNAFEEFRGAYYLQRRALGDLRFWRLLERASTLIGRPSRSSVTIEMLFDADKCALFFAYRDEHGEAAPFTTLNSALVAVGAENSENLSTAASLGIVFFRLIGTGRWRAEPEARDSAFGLHIAVADRHKRKIGDRLGPLATSGDWAITTNPLSVEVLKDALNEAKLLPSKKELIVRPCLSGGIRSGGIWLGRPRFFPSLDSDTCDYVIRDALPRGSGCLLKIEKGQLMAPKSIDGAFFIHPVKLRGEDQAPWNIRLQFVRNAFVHPMLDGARYRLSPLKDWIADQSLPVDVSTQDILGWELGEPACVDLLEAVYASGQSGWEEAQIIALLKCADDVMSPWLLLRSLRDAGIVEPRLRSGWKGRVWTLREPVIIEVYLDGQTLVLVEGALCTRMVEDFKLAAEGLGGIPFRRLGVTDWAVPLFGAQNVQGQAIAECLGWRFESAFLSPSEKPLAFVETPHQALHYEQTRAWSWTKGRFVSIDETQESVRLVRLTHTGERDHDVYSVEQNGLIRHYFSHTAAIVSAYALARKPLFKWSSEKNLIVLTTLEGGLPDALAAAMRRRMLRNGGPSSWEYIYPANREMVCWLDRVLPGCIGGSFHGPQQAKLSLIGVTRRSSGRLRLQWRNGSTTI